MLKATYKIYSWYQCCHSIVVWHGSLSVAQVGVNKRYYGQLSFWQASVSQLVKYQSVIQLSVD